MRNGSSYTEIRTLPHAKILNTALLKLNAKPFSDQFAVISGELSLPSLRRRLAAEGAPKSVCRANLRQDEGGWKISVASGRVGVTRGRDQSADRECEKPTDAPSTIQTIPAIWVTGPAVFHTNPPATVVCPRLFSEADDRVELHLSPHPRHHGGKPALETGNPVGGD